MPAKKKARVKKPHVCPTDPRIAELEAFCENIFENSNICAPEAVDVALGVMDILDPKRKPSDDEIRSRARLA